MASFCRYTKLIVLWLLVTTWCQHSVAQPPAKPDMYYVTVDPETGHDIIYWNASPSGNVSYYVVAEAVIINPDEPYVAQQIDIVNPPNTSYVYTNPASGLHSVGYTVWATNDQGGGVLFPSLFDDPDSTIFLQWEYDTCLNEVTLMWNDYNKWRGSILEYNIYRRLGPNIYVKLATLSEGYHSYTRLLTESGANYELFVEAVHNDNLRRSNSNLIQFISTDFEGPEFINADYATINANNTIDLSFTIGSPGPFQYNLVRSTNETGGFNVISEIDQPGAVITYTDPVPFESGVYYYRLEALNNCGTAGTASNLASNMLLSGSMQQMQVTLNWNDYLNWQQGVDHYTVRRYIGSDVVEMNGGLTTEFVDDIDGLIDYSAPVSNQICYEIEAMERLNSYGTQAISTSNRYCLSLNPIAQVPNAVVPNDPEQENRIFEPVFSFAPERYQISIYNRLGLKIWEGSGPWDGRVNGEFVREGIYLYHIRIYSTTGDDSEVSGSLSVIYR